MEELGSSILKYYEILKGLLYVSFVLVIAWYFYKRAGSNYSMLSRIWSLIIGRKDFNDSQITKLIQEREDIDKFNFIFNIKATSMAQIKRLQKRVEKQSIDIKLISRSKGYFYINTCKLKVPKTRQLIGVALVCVVLFFCIFPLLQIASKPAAAIKFHDSDPWIWVNHEYAEKYILPIPIISTLIKGWRFDKETCASATFSIEKIADITKLTKQEVETICESFKEERNNPIIDKVIKGQKVGYFVFLIPLILALLSLRELFYMICTYELRHTLLRKKGKIKLRHNTKYTGV